MSIRMLNTVRSAVGNFERGDIISSLPPHVEAALVDSGDAVQVAGGLGLLTDAQAQAVQAEFGSFKPAVLLGDSITAQHSVLGSGIHVVGSQGFWNWSNWTVGAPFDFVNLGVSGSNSTDAFSRAWQIPPDINSVFVLTGTNDVFAVSSSANAAAISAAVNALIGPAGAIFEGLNKLRAMGKRIAIATIPPNAAYTAGDSRIQVLDQVNAWIRTTRVLGLADEVLDLFTVCWDASAPTTRVFKSGYGHSDGTHLTNLAGLTAGLEGRQLMKNMYANASGRASWFDQAYNTLLSVSAMRAISGVSSTISTGGTGTAATDMASGWRSTRGSGSPTWTCSLVDYVAAADYVGPMAAAPQVGEKMQRILYTAGADTEYVRVQLASNMAANGQLLTIDKGDVIAPGADIWVQTPTNLGRVEVTFAAFFASGTAPVDQAYGSSANQVRSHANLRTSDPAYAAIPQGFRAYIRGAPVRVPENITGPSGTALTGQMYIDPVLVGSDATLDVRIGRPSLWRRVA